MSPTTTRSSPRRARSNRSASGSSTISGRPRQCISQKPTTARELRISVPRGDVVVLARGDPVGDEAPERRERRERRVEDLAAGHLEHDVDPPAAVGLVDALREVLRRDVERRVGAELERERALLLASRPSRSRARRPSACASWTASEPTPPAAACDHDALALARCAPRCGTGARPSGPGAAARAPSRRRRRRGSGTSSSAGAVAYSA